MFKTILFWQPATFAFHPVWFLFSHWFLWLVIGGLTIWWWHRKKPKLVVEFWILLVIAQIIEMLMKSISPWPRPFFQTGVTPPHWFSKYSTGSFPSGHALRSGIILAILWQRAKKYFWLLLPGIFLVNLTRICFGLHYPIDILGGIVMGIILVALKKRWFKNGDG